MITFSNHAFKGLDTSLANLFGLMESMRDATQQLIALLPEGLQRTDEQMFIAAKAIDKSVNERELAIDQAVADIINKFPPTAEDLRFILASVKAAGILERAADKIKNCIKRLNKVTHPLDAEVRSELAEGIDAVRLMLASCLQQMLDYRPAEVKTILESGARVQSSYRAILLRLHQPNHGVLPTDTTHLLLIAKNLEQAADKAVEIVKIAHYVNFGTKYDKSQVS